MASTLWIGNNNVIEIGKDLVGVLTNDVTDAVDTAATVTCTLKDSAAVDVTGDTWPKAMAHATGGNYVATLSDAIAIVADAIYTAHVDVVGTGGEVAHWEIALTAKVRNT